MGRNLFENNGIPDDELDELIQKVIDGEMSINDVRLLQGFRPVEDVDLLGPRELEEETEKPLLSDLRKMEGFTTTKEHLARKTRGGMGHGDAVK